MKYNISFLLVFILLISCTDNPRKDSRRLVNPGMVVTKTLINPYDSIGLLHNKGLDYILVNIELLPGVDTLGIICSATADFFESIKVSPGPKTYDQLIQEYIELFGWPEIKEQEFILDAIDTGLDQMVHEKIVSIDYADNLVALIDLIMNDDMVGVEELAVSITESNIIEKEKQNLLSGVAVGIHSRSYWMMNITSWEKEFFEGPIELDAWIFIADLIGATYEAYDSDATTPGDYAGDIGKGAMIASTWFAFGRYASPN